MWSLTAAVKAYLISRWIQDKAQRTYLVVAASTKEAATIQRDLEFFLGKLAEGEVCLFPPHDALPFGQEAAKEEGRALLQQRLLRALHSYVAR